MGTLFPGVIRVGIPPPIRFPAMAAAPSTTGTQSRSPQHPRPHDWSLVSQAEVMALLRNRGYPDPLGKRPAANTVNSLHAYLAANMGLARRTNEDGGSIDERGTWRSDEAFPNAKDAQLAARKLKELGWSARDICQVLDARPISLVELSFCLNKDSPQIEQADAVLEICKDLLHGEVRRRHRLPRVQAQTALESEWQEYAEELPADDDLVDAQTGAGGEDDFLEDDD